MKIVEAQLSKIPKIDALTSASKTLQQSLIVEKKKLVDSLTQKKNLELQILNLQNFDNQLLGKGSGMRKQVTADSATLAKYAPLIARRKKEIKEQEDMLDALKKRGDNYKKFET